MEIFFKSSTLLNIIDLFKVFNQFGNKKLNSINISYIDRYLSSIVSTRTKLEYLDYYKFQIDTDSNLENDIFNTTFQILEKLNSELSIAQKYELYISIYGFSNFIKDNDTDNKIESLLELTYTKFNLSQKDVIDIVHFSNKAVDLIQSKENVIILGDFKRIKPKTFVSIQCQYLNGNLFALYIHPIKGFLIRYRGSDSLTLNNSPIFSDRTYLFSIGGIIEGDNIKPIFYSTLLSKTHSLSENKVELIVQKISKTYKNTNLGIKPLSFSISSGQLMAIIGGSGSGKTTLLNLLSGNTNPDSGKIFINGLNLKNYNSTLRKHIGFVPQDDLLIEEITVFQNLLFSIKLSKDDLSSKEQIQLVEKTLTDLDLLNVSHLKVGSPLNKVISGGQRKRLNIALEIIRKPSIIYLDEPTSGLSSSDAFSVINLLKDLTYKGKIVIINIHQPSSDIFYLFDQLLILDNAGYTAYCGNPVWAAKYFKKHLEFEDSPIDDNIKFGHYSPERIIHLMEYKAKDDNGKLTNKRVFNGKQWFKKYISENDGILTENIKKSELPEPQTKKPNIVKQFFIFVSRNFKTRIADTPYMLLLVFSSPILAVMMSVFLKSTDIKTHEYSFINNDNIPTYLFISVIISIFQGLVVSSGEIFRDLSILKREAFLELSPFAYLNSKLVYLFLINAYQISTYILIANTFLEIKDLFWQYFILLWITSNTASLIGLYISSSFQSILSIYITIPFILIPKILLAGAILDFDKVHHSLSSKKFVPFYADLTISRWSYEGLVNIQFAQNKYDHEVYADLIDKSNIQYHLFFILPLLKSEINNLNKSDQNRYKSEHTIKMILEELITKFPVLKKEKSIKDLDIYNIESLISFSKKIDKWLKLSLHQKNEKIEQIRANNDFDKRNYFNQQLSEFVLTSSELTNYIRSDDEIIRKYQPGYHVTDNQFGRSHYYAPYKHIGRYRVETWKYNSFILILYGSILYILVYSRLTKNKV